MVLIILGWALARFSLVIFEWGGRGARGRGAAEGTDIFESMRGVLDGCDLDKMVPLTLHGDGTPVTGVGKSWGKSGDFWSWASVLGYSSYAALVRYLIVMLHSHSRTRKTLDCFFTKLKWSFKWLRLGRRLHLM